LATTIGAASTCFTGAATTTGFGVSFTKAGLETT